MKILVAIDQSRHAGKVLDRALDLAKKDKAELIVITVAESSVDVEGGIGLTISDQLVQRAKDAAESARCQAVQSGVPPKIVVESGPSPEANILDCAEKYAVDLIVMGTRGKTGLERFFIGSVASKVVTHARCSVLVVR